MRRLSLSTKLFAAALPLVIAVGALLALTVRNDLDKVDHAERGADLGKVWTPLVASINAIEAELDAIPARPDADTPGGIAEVDPEQSAKLTTLRRATDQSLTALGDALPSGAPQHVVLESPHGVTILERFPNGSTVLVLAGDHGDVGQLLHDLRLQRPAIAELV